MILYTFSKEEKLCSQKLIGQLFISGNSFFCYPFKLIWSIPGERNTGNPIQVAFSVPKRNFKRAHDRNLIKRVMRESYRYRKERLNQRLKGTTHKLTFMIVYAGKEKLQFSEMESAMDKAINRLEREYLLKTNIENVGI